MHAPPLSPLTNSRQNNHFEIVNNKLNKRVLYEKHAQIEADKSHIKLIDRLVKNIQTNLLTNLSEYVKDVCVIGPFAKGIMLKSDKLIQLVITLKSYPDYYTVKEVANRLQLTDMFNNSQSSDKFYVDANFLQTEYNLNLTHFADGLETKFQLMFTCDEIAQTKELSDENFQFPIDLCSKLNETLRQLRWFELRLKPIHNSLIILKILRDMCHSNSDWQQMDDWLLELLVCLIFHRRNSVDLAVKFGEFFEIISAGVLLLSELNLACKYLGVVDSGEVFCLKDFDDNLVEVDSAKRENLSRVAQHALRLIAFRKIDILLGLKALPERQTNSN